MNISKDEAPYEAFDLIHLSQLLIDGNLKLNKELGCLMFCVADIVFSLNKTYNTMSVSHDWHSISYKYTKWYNTPIHCCGNLYFRSNVSGCILATNCARFTPGFFYYPTKLQRTAWGLSIWRWWIGAQFSLYSISQEICTRFCCALLCCGYAIVHNELTWSIYPYSSELLCWHWGNR